MSSFSHKFTDSVVSFTQLFCLPVRNIDPIYKYMLAFYYFFLIESFPMPNQYFTIISLNFLSRNSTSKTIPEYLIAKVPFLFLKL